MHEDFERLNRPGGLPRPSEAPSPARENVLRRLIKDEALKNRRGVLYQFGIVRASGASKRSQRLPNRREHRF
jgi:hypothetical protein